MSKKNEQLQLELKELQAEKETLVNAKNTSPDKFTEKQQARLDEVVIKIVDIEEQIESTQQTQQTQQKAKYVPEPGTENLIHAEIVRGQRFDEYTGKEISSSYIQKFTYGEFKNFEEKANLIGYKIVKVLYNPFEN